MDVLANPIIAQIVSIDVKRVIGYRPPTGA